MTSPRSTRLLVGLLALVSVFLSAGNAEADKPFPGTKKLFYISFHLRHDTAAIERGYIEALPSVARAVDGILLFVPSYYEAPEAPSHPHVQRTLELCRELGLELYWGRGLWVSWPKGTSYVQQREDVFSAAYYAAYLTRLDAEAKRLQAAGTFVYGEPHGDSILEEQWFKRTGVTDQERERIHQAIAAAVRVAPRATMAYPGGGRNPEHFAFALRPLGGQFLYHQSYRVKRPEFLSIKPPEGEQVQLHWWGIWLTMDPASPPGKGAFTVDEWLRFDLAGAVRRFPEMQQGGLWLYVESPERREVMLELGKKLAPSSDPPSSANSTADP